MDLRQIVQRAALMLPEAMVVGVNSEAANLAGPAADVEAWSWRKVAAKQGRAWHLSQVEDDDEHHPLTVVGTWCRMLAEDYGLDCPVLSDLSTAAGFLDRLLGRVAQDDEQDFPLLARELRRCRQHLESVLRDSLQPERGAPCPRCQEVGTFVRLTREYGHYCDDEACDRLNYLTDEADQWTCPRNREHVWSVEDYSRWVEERTRTA